MLPSSTKLLLGPRSNRNTLVHNTALFQADIEGKYLQILALQEGTLKPLLWRTYPFEAGPLTSNLVMC